MFGSESGVYKQSEGVRYEVGMNQVYETGMNVCNMCCTDACM